MPGAVLHAGTGDVILGTLALGRAATGPDRPVTESTVFDLASLTKVTATLPVLLSLIAGDTLQLSDRVADLLPGFGRDGDREQVTVEHLLTHTSGLPPDAGDWRLALPAPELRARFEALPLDAAPWTRVAYSDIGFLDLGWIAETLTGRSLDRLVADVVTGPLGMHDTGYAPAPGHDVAATERRPDGTLVEGTVHDEKAAALGGVCGHAGLWSTAADLGRYLAAWVGAGDGWLPAALRRAATADRTASLGGHRGLGWTARHDVHDRLGPDWPEGAVFHSGFTGTSMALDPASGRWVVLLTNDVHFGRNRGRIAGLREAVNTALAP